MEGRNKLQVAGSLLLFYIRIQPLNCLFLLILSIILDETLGEDKTLLITTTITTFVLHTDLSFDKHNLKLISHYSSEFNGTQTLDFKNLFYLMALKTIASNVKFEHHGIELVFSHLL